MSAFDVAEMLFHLREDTLLKYWIYFHPLFNGLTVFEGMIGVNMLSGIDPF